MYDIENLNILIERGNKVQAMRNPIAESSEATSAPCAISPTVEMTRKHHFRTSKKKKLSTTNYFAPAKNRLPDYQLKAKSQQLFPDSKIYTTDYRLIANDYQLPAFSRHRKNNRLKTND